MSVLSNKRFIQLFLIVLSVFMIIAGIMREEAIDVAMHAGRLCLSCIGIK